MMVLLPRMRPDDAVAGIILDHDDRYLLQLRDDRDDIFFPVQWGCFGGAVEEGESDHEALLRELEEELGISVAALETTVFTCFTFGFEFAGRGTLRRTFFELRLPAALSAAIRLGEGQEVRAFTAAELPGLPLVPYDGFALWMHANQDRIE